MDLADYSIIKNLATDRNNDIITIIGLGITLLFLIICSTFFSGSETAITTTTEFQWNNFVRDKKQKKSHVLVLKLINNYKDTLLTILIGNTLVNVAATTTSTLFFTQIGMIAKIGDPETFALVMGTVIMTIIILIFGEYIPKSFARNHNIKYMQYSVYIIYGFYILFFPITKLLNLLSKNKKEKTVSESELSALIDIVKREGILETQEANLVKNAIEFDDTTVEQLSTDINDMEFVRYEKNNKNILERFLLTDYSRLPVLDDKNKCIGILNYKQFNKEYYKDKNFDIKTILHPIASVSKTTNLNVVLRLMQLTQTHMTVIKENQEDDHIIGLITLENILEALVGKINDETDDVEMISKINNHTWIINQDANIHDFLKNDLKNDDYLLTDENMIFIDWIKELFPESKIQNDLFLKTNFCDIYCIKDHKLEKFKFMIELRK